MAFILFLLISFAKNRTEGLGSKPHAIGSGQHMTNSKFVIGRSRHPGQFPTCSLSATVHCFDRLFALRFNFFFEMKKTGKKFSTLKKFGKHW